MQSIVAAPQTIIVNGRYVGNKVQSIVATPQTNIVNLLLLGNKVRNSNAWLLGVFVLIRYKGKEILSTVRETALSITELLA